jgi:hypothetical protein
MTAPMIHALISLAICVAIFTNLGFLVRAIRRGWDSFKYSMINGALATLNTGHAVIGRDQEAWFLWIMIGGWVIVMVTTTMTIMARRTSSEEN